MSKKELFAAMRTLKSEGFEHTHSVMDDCGTGGLFFTNDSTGKHAVIRRSEIIYLD